MTKIIPIYLSQLIKKFPLILSGRKNISKNHQRIVKIKTAAKMYKIHSIVPNSEYINQLSLQIHSPVMWNDTMKSLLKRNC